MWGAIFERDKWQEILGTIQKNKVRSLLTALGVFWGIFMLMFLLGMSNGLENGVYKDFGSRARNIMYVWSNQTTMPYKGWDKGRRIQLKLEDIGILRERVSELNLIAPRNEIGPYPVDHQGKSNDYAIRGELTDMVKIEAFQLRSGRYINALDIDQARKVAVIGETVRDELFESDVEAVGQHIRIQGIDFIVIGVFGPEIPNERNRDDKEAIVIPLPTMSRAFGIGDDISYMVLSAKDNVPVSQMEPKVRRTLKEIHQIHPDDPQGIGGFNLEKELQKINALFTGIKFFAWIIGIGTLLAGVIGVSNIMLIVVKERTKEIGIRKALGAPPRAIISLILTESVFITATSGYFGIAVGTGLIWLINWGLRAAGVESGFYNPEIDWYVGIASLLVLVIAGLLAGLFPARQAAKVNPVVALKNE